MGNNKLGIDSSLPRTFAMVCYSGAHPGNIDSGSPKFGSERTVELFVANYSSQRRTRVSLSVNTGRRWHGKY